MPRAETLQAIADIVCFATVTAARLGASNSVELQIKGTDDDPADADWCEWWGDPAVSFMPEPGAEAMYIDLNGERVVLGVKSRKYQIAVKEGECVVRAYGGDSPAFIKLKPDGTAEVHASRIDLGGESIETLLARADRTDARLTKIQSAFDAHVHPTAAVGPPSPATPVPGSIPIGPLPTVAADKVHGS